MLPIHEQIIVRVYGCHDSPVVGKKTKTNEKLENIENTGTVNFDEEVCHLMLGKKIKNLKYFVNCILNPEIWTIGALMFP